LVGRDLCIFWNPYKGLYANRWLNEPREFTYSGEGSVGDQRAEGGNLWLLQHEASGQPVRLFVKTRAQGSAWMYLGAYRVVEHSEGTSQGTDEKWRRDLRFHFEVLPDEASRRPLRTSARPPVASPKLGSEEELWNVLQHGASATGERRRGTKTHFNKRLSDPLKTDYVVQRAIEHGGVCELCDVSTGWLRENGRPHFQAHHIHPDIDLVDWIAALCGTCHDRMHHSTDRSAVAEHLLAKIQARQRTRGRPIVTRQEVDEHGLANIGLP
jgi:hypothetical protein